MPTAAVSLESLPHWLQVLLVVLGAVVPVASLVASILNQYVRTAVERGERVPTLLLAIVGGINAAALNPDKAVQTVAIAKTQPAPEVKP